MGTVHSLPETINLDGMMMFFDHMCIRPRRIVAVSCLIVQLALLPWVQPAAVCAAAAANEQAAGEHFLLAQAMAEVSAKAVAASRFDASMLEEDIGAESRTVQHLLKDIEQVEHDYLDRLEGHRSSYGIYAIGEYDYDLEDSDARYSAGLEWRLFNDGYYEAMREDAKKMLQSQLEFYQLRRDMNERVLGEQLYELAALENATRLQQSREKVALLAEIVSRRKEQLREGYTTEFDVQDSRRRLSTARHNLRFYQDADKMRLPEGLLRLLNRVETLALRPADELRQLARDNSLNLKIQDNFIERTTSFASWIDDFALNVHTLYRQEFLGTERSLVGVEVEVPLSFDGDRAALITMQQRIYRYQKEAVARRLEQQIDRLRSLFTFHQQQLHQQQEQLDLILLQQAENQEKQKRVTQALEDDPARTLDQLAITLLDGRTEALLLRLKIYEFLVKLTALTQVGSVQELFLSE